MIINPNFAIEQQWVTFPSSMQENIDKYIQPNAIDFTLDVLHEPENGSEFILSESRKQMRPHIKVNVEDDGFWELSSNKFYDGLSDIYVKIPLGVACLLVSRSTLIRNGLFITSGLYDSGFYGHIGCVIHNTTGISRIEPGTRIGQIIFVASPNSGAYNGSYSHQQNTLWT